MPNPIYQVQPDATSIARIAAMVASVTQISAYYTAAMNASVNYVNRLAQENAPVLHGRLRSGIRGYTLSPVLGVVGVVQAVPYGRRRELGFDNQTDALGRHYEQDPLDSDKRAHMFYLRRALISSEPFIMQTYSTATMAFVRDMGSSALGGA